MGFPMGFSQPSMKFNQRGVRSPRRGAAAGVLWDAAGGRDFLVLRAADEETSNVKRGMYDIIPSGILTELWKITMFNGKIHYKWENPLLP